ncbi:hypothetical protein LAZ40_17510 [Cereibacter sphaeroides]|uniref:hypothetical protein n=1 Tax=Cereibacter sphaeroides TaxID=1063 RepID=UPI001F27121C|nr:hypothetical protein [Cereibacter sphaeroides]MCE6951501.1 hypothetical protein [Cereibacter sphaeroides]MCE6960826.1 hypothetical protein [Cereibacter sphaeroides]MCE6969908.1 hypothetical protein [Cereibacter sphaeroides]MCE6974296.1 hypothetical protein [Cereibacter sphaeroides]
MNFATVQISPYISARGPVVAVDPASGLVTVRDGSRTLTGRPVAPATAPALSA